MAGGMNTHYLLTWVPPSEGLPGHVSPLKLLEVPELPEDKHGKHGGCTGCIGLAKASLCHRIQVASDHVCEHKGVIFKPKVEIH